MNEMTLYNMTRKSYIVRQKAVNCLNEPCKQLHFTDLDVLDFDLDLDVRKRKRVENCIGDFTRSSMLANTFDNTMFERMFERVKGVNMLDQRVGRMSDRV